MYKVLWAAPAILIAAACSTWAMGKSPDADGPPQTNSASTPPPANPFYNPPSNTGTSAPENQGSMPLNKGSVAIPSAPPADSPAAEQRNPPPNAAATGVGPYGGSPSGPSGGR